MQKINEVEQVTNADNLSFLGIDSDGELVQCAKDDIGMSNDSIIAGDYDSEATYNVDDMCVRGMKLYRCITAVTTGEEFDVTKWQETSIASYLYRMNELYNEKLNQQIEQININLSDNIDAINSNLSEFSNTPLTANNHGKLTLKDGLTIIWGSYPMNSMARDTAIGGYSYTINLSSYNLTGTVWANVSAYYPGGFPRVGISQCTRTALKITSDVNVSTGYVYWFVIGTTT